MHIQTTNDRELWDSFKAGDDRAFSQIYETYADLLFSYGMRFTSNREIVRDTLQELFIKLYKNRKNLSTTDHIKFYLFCAFRHQLQNELAKVIPSVDITECETTFTLDQSALDQLIYDEKELNRQKKLNQLLNDLPVRQKMVIQYRLIEGLKYEEIAQLMDMNYQSVHNLLQRALNKIREEWQDDKSLLLTFFLIRRMQEGR